MRLILVPLALMLVLGAASAGTVTLSGSCSTGTINSTANYTTFYLTNSGNETATSLLLVPDFGGATAANASVSLQAIAPNQSISSKVYFHNFSVPGSYSGSFTIEYTQGQSTFFALFPCVLSFLNATQSLASITGVNRTGNVISVFMVDIGQGQIDANVSLLLPAGFQARPASQNVTLSPGAQETVAFTVSYPQASGAYYAAAASLSYTQGGMHFSTVRPYTIGFAASPAAVSHPEYLLYLAGAAVIVIIIGLILFSRVRKKKPGKRSARHDDAHAR